MSAVNVTRVVLVLATSLVWSGSALAQVRLAPSAQAQPASSSTNGTLPTGVAALPPLEAPTLAPTADPASTAIVQPAADSAAATSAPENGAMTAAPPSQQSDAWNIEFAKAKHEFIAGRFAIAAARFEALGRRARNPVEQARVEELLQAAREWTRRDVALIEQRELIGSDLLSRRTDRRTADEIGVLYLSALAYGLGTGAWVDFLAEPESLAGVVVPPLLLAGAAVGGVALLDRGKGLRYGAAQSIATGMTIGFWQGFAWSTYYQATSAYDSQMEAESYVSLLWATTTAGAVAGGIIGSVNSTTPGRAAFVGSATLWPAAVFGLGAAALSSSDDYQDDRAMLASALGASLGTVGGVLLAGSVSPTTARVRFLDLGAIGGGLAVGGLTLALRGEDSEDGREILLATDLGIVAGLGLAWWLTDNMPRDLGAEKPSAAFKPTITPTVLPQRGGLGLGALGTF